MSTDPLKRARGSLFGTRSRAAAYFTRAARLRVSPDYRGQRMISAAILLLFLMQMVTGVLLSLYYYPEPEAAYESARFLTGRVTAGWLLRSVHHWTAELFVVGVALHLIIAFFRRGYGGRREYLWMSGALLLVLALGSRFTGRLLPWDTVGLEATRLGLDMLSAVPVVGGVTATWLRGGEHLGPHFALRLGILFVYLVTVLVVLTAFAAPGLGDLADPTADPGVGAPEWYLRPLGAFLSLFPPALRWLGGTLVLLFWVLLFAWPFLDRSDPDTPRGRRILRLARFMGAGLILLVILLGLVPL